VYRVDESGRAKGADRSSLAGRRAARASDGMTEVMSGGDVVKPHGAGARSIKNFTVSRKEELFDPLAQNDASSDRSYAEYDLPVSRAG